MVKPTKMRNQRIYQATLQTRSKQMGSSLSKDLQKKYGKKSARVVEGDTVTILRGEFKGVDGKIARISTQKSSVAIDGVKKEKTKGDKFDVYIHTSNLVITALNSTDKWRIAKLEGKDPKKQPKQTATENKTEPKVEKEVKKKEVEK
ncbi:MAG: 50S ribosomal protein L24 [Candidatus Nitrosopumilus limneticus]|nr:50S ribosomal protein L24 [Candidatus Nitrosopumilus limneticus]MDA0669176.1 50S ribosomal protein L24 [Thermoproteota archaeon]HJJ21452.1 50S ribosomal protein L24 [Nitrosopumilus sp.]MDA0852954.1 50S ribosomal protein L24 [Thermoproteota archaeon]MDA1122918.1 50S ribosomal protein L24 [Thermoproteota archaeon]